MLFNSVSFFVFFPIVTALYFLLPHRSRVLLLLLASCYFYMCFLPKYLLILAFTITVDYFAGIWIEKSTGRRRRLLLLASIIANLGVLFFFKYFNFFSENIASIADWIGWNYSISTLKILLPIGLSFHTFQSLSYTIEVYRGKQSSERSFWIFALYVMFYPQLVAGPIERPQNLLHQFREKHEFDYRRLVSGLELMLWGLFKKVVIADRLAIFVNEIFGSGGYSGPALVLGIIFFAFQIYCDFSGYSDIAIGAAQTMGFKLMKNFDRPYLASSITEFWRRWHISLSTWFRDYVYIPLGGNRVKKSRWLINLFLTFLLSGLWHGASWNFVVWGALNGIYLIGEALLARKEKIQSSRLATGFKVLFTFGLTSFAWIFFRAKNLTQAVEIIKGLFSGWNEFWLVGSGQIFLKNIPIIGIKTEYILAILSIGLLVLIEWRQKNLDIREYFAAQPRYLTALIYSLIFLAVVILGVFQNNQFIYFQF